MAERGVVHADLQLLGLGLIGFAVTVVIPGVVLGSIGARLTGRRHRDW